MTTAVKAIYEDGVFKPTEPVTLKEHTQVEVHVPAETAADDDDPTGWKAAEEIIGIIKDAPPDMAEFHDFYLYGRPRR
jgi:predicted DNA-binding antitoxin AbrB/MazE fold protein